MTTAPLDELYFQWLYGQVGSLVEANPSRTFWRMLKQLYKKEFVWIIQHDDNRAVDGKDLRREFVEREGLRRVDKTWLRLGCSMLELLIGLSRRLAFEGGGEPHIWFWTLIENVGLERYTDASRFNEHEVDEILDRIIFRTYNPNGEGGLFPVVNTDHDFRQIELWYQLNEYLISREAELYS